MMKMELRKVRLGEIATVSCTSMTPQDGICYNLYSLPSYDNGNQCEVVYGNLIMSNKYVVPNKCILFNKLNVRFKRVWRINNDDDNKICSTEFLPLLFNEELVDYDYIYYVLISDEITNYLCGQHSNTSGSHQRIDPCSFLELKVNLPPLSVQRRIGKLLSDIDRKIALNRRMNATLEAMARQLYDYWFLQFDFPDAHGKPYKSSGGKMTWNNQLKRDIPEGWEASNICSISDVLSGGTPSKAIVEYWDNGSIPFFGPTDYDGSMFQLGTSDHITKEGLSHCASILFKEGDIFITARGSIGKLVIVGNPMAMNQSCYALRSRYGRVEYLYFLAIQLIECLKAKGSGSVFKSITLSDIENSSLCIASPDTIETFCEKASPIFQRIKENIRNITTLTRLRSTLLPLLMNGQVSVS